MATSSVGAGGYATRHNPRGRTTKRRRFGLSRRNAGGFVSVGVIATTVVAMALTLFGAGAISRALSVHDGAIWLWDSNRGEASRVNAAAGRVDMRRSLADARGHRVVIVQSDENLLLQDLDSGTVTSFNLTTLNVSGVVATSRPIDMKVALSGSNVLMTDTVTGVIRQLDAGRLDPIGKPLKLAPNLVGGGVDDDGRLWLGSSKSGKAIAVKPGTGGSGPSVDRDVDVGHANHDWSMSVLDHGAAIVDRTTSSFTKIGGDGNTSSVQLPPVGAATMPDRLRGDVVAITNPAARQIVLVHNSQVNTVAVPGDGDKIGPALVFSQLLYVPDEQADRIRVFDLSGKNMQDIEDPGGKVELENREDHLVINSVGTDKAWVVDSTHNVKELEKAPKDVINGEGSGKPATPAVPNPNNPGTNQGSQSPPSAGQLGQTDNGNSQQINKPNPSPPPKGGNQGPQLPVTPPTNSGPGGPNPSKPADQAAKPGAPGPVKAVAGDGSAILNWAAAAPNGSTITKYIVTGGNGTVNVAGDAQSVTLTGLNNGTSYQFSVHAVNGKGDGPVTKSNPVTPTTVVPDAPTNVQAAANSDGSVSVSWAAPATHGGTIASYQLVGQTDTAGGQMGINNIASTSVVVPASALTMGASYTFQITATLTNGASGQPSASSNQVTTRSAPGAPGSVSAKGNGEGTVDVSWAPAIANGSPITEYVVTSSSGQQVNAARDATSAKLTGLPAGEQVTVTVTAVNAAGKTPGRSVTVTVPGAPAPPPPTTPPPTTPPPPPPPPPVTGPGVVACVNTSANPTYCDGGVRTFSEPNQQSSVRDQLMNGNRQVASCKIQGQNITSWAYNNNKTSTWWMKINDGSYIPYAWFNLDGGQATLDKLPTC
ncbi:MAG TPA: fibronectin type III domain-containing protein [Mycobacteriales bacterium]|jgi:hypothetical protein|nr:fibronectin type III domain-containing protein [Mycobacteriales bacterium]